MLRKTSYTNNHMKVKHGDEYVYNKNGVLVCETKYNEGKITLNSRYNDDGMLVCIEEFKPDECCATFYTNDKIDLVSIRSNDNWIHNTYFDEQLIKMKEVLFMKIPFRVLSEVEYKEGEVSKTIYNIEEDYSD
jgi:antitoxin component YwqK of YwqJK toxin-antitoxin module